MNNKMTEYEEINNCFSADGTDYSGRGTKE